MHTEFWWGNLREENHLEDPGLDGRITLKCIFEKWVGRHGLDRSDSGYGQVAGCCECGNEPSVSLKCEEFLEYLRPLKNQSNDCLILNIFQVSGTCCFYALPPVLSDIVESVAAHHTR